MSFSTRPGLRLSDEAPASAAPTAAAARYAGLFASLTLGKAKPNAGGAAASPRASLEPRTQTPFPADFCHLVRPPQCPGLAGVGCVG